MNTEIITGGNIETVTETKTGTEKENTMGATETVKKTTGKATGEPATATRRATDKKATGTAKPTETEKKKLEAEIKAAQIAEKKKKEEERKARLDAKKAEKKPTYTRNNAIADAIKAIGKKGATFKELEQKTGELHQGKKDVKGAFYTDQLKTVLFVLTHNGFMTEEKGVYKKA